MLFPNVKKQALGEYRPLSESLTVCCADAPSVRLLPVMEAFFPYLSFVRTDCQRDAAITLSVRPAMAAQAEFYTLSVKGGRIAIRAKDFRGLVNAAATLTRLVTFADGALSVRDAEIEDFPDAAFRSMMADPHSGWIPMEEMRAQILCMAKAKMNKLHLHLCDGRGFAYESAVYPDLPRTPSGCYTRAQLEEIIAYAARFAIDVIPELDIPAHSAAIVNWRPEMRCQPEQGSALSFSPWCMCFGNPVCYEVIEGLIGELAAIFPYEYLHVGTDEIHMGDLTEHPARPFCHTEECRVCNGFFDPMGVRGIRERFYWFLRRVYDIAAAHGKKLMMWNDTIDISVDPDIPHDILIEFWRVAAEKRGPVEGCSMQRFLEEGFAVVNADFPNTYIEEYMEWERLRDWSYLRDPADATPYPYRVLGGEMCAWGGCKVPFFDYVLYYAIAAFGARLWSAGEQLEDKAARRALTRATLGCSTPEGFDLFDYTRGVPLGDALTMDCILAEDADRASLRRILEGLSHQSGDEARVTAALLKLLDTPTGESTPIEIAHA